MDLATAPTPDRSAAGLDAQAATKPLLDAPQSLAAAIAMWTFVVGPLHSLSGHRRPRRVGLGAFRCSTSPCGPDRRVRHSRRRHRSGLPPLLHTPCVQGQAAQAQRRIALAVAGSLAVEGSPVQWVASHRRHHAFADREGDPHSPWRYGTDARALLEGLLYAHLGWMLRRELSNRARFAPDIAADRDLRLVGRLFGPLTALSLLGPALVGWLATGTVHGALEAFFWAGLMRMGLLHHITWSVNSVCHVVGKQPFSCRDRDRAANFWPLALISFGESWHNGHHADPSGARHGVLPGQLDPAARIIWLFERLRWAHDV